MNILKISRMAAHGQVSKKSRGSGSRLIVDMDTGQSVMQKDPQLDNIVEPDRFCRCCC